MLLRVELMILEESREERSLAGKKIPKQTVERIFLRSVLVCSHFFNDLLEFFPVVGPERQSEVSHPIPIYDGFVIL